MYVCLSLIKKVRIEVLISSENFRISRIERSSIFCDRHLRFSFPEEGAARGSLEQLTFFFVRFDSRQGVSHAARTPAITV